LKQGPSHPAELPAADPARVIAAARTWLGTPYHDQASLPRRRAAIASALRAASGAKWWGQSPYPIPPYSRDWGETGPVEILAEGARRMMIEVSPADAPPGALLLFRMRPGAIAKHVGILTGPATFLHAYERLGVIEEPLTSIWRRRIAFAFLFPEL